MSGGELSPSGACGRSFITSGVFMSTTPAAPEVENGHARRRIERDQLAEARAEQHRGRTPLVPGHQATPRVAG